MWITLLKWNILPKSTFIQHESRYKKASSFIITYHQAWHFYEPTFSQNGWILLGFTPRRFKDTIQGKNCALGFCTQIGFEATLFVLKNVPSYALRGWPQAFQNHQWGWGQLTSQPHFNDGISTKQSLLVTTYSCNWLKEKV